MLRLIHQDQLPGQPKTTADMLAEAVAGRSVIDAGWWAELDPPQVDVAYDAGSVVGVVSYATRPRDDAGLILWLHCVGDAPEVAGALVGHAVAQLGAGRMIHAFDFASALSLGLEGLPVRHRSGTVAALDAAGFVGRDLWRYMRGRLPIDASFPRVAEFIETESDDPFGLRLEVHDDVAVVAHARIGYPVDRIGVLWWIGVDPAARGRGLGTALLGSALDKLANLGAREVILFVDDDAEPGDPERDRSAANRMYDRVGLTEIDRLWSFTRPGHQLTVSKVSSA